VNSSRSLATAALLLLVSLPAHAGQPDPATVVGPSQCAECHKVEVKIWEATHHFRTFTELPRSDDARKIADALGIRRIKSESLCLGCHFLQLEADGQTDAVAGIGCESCHGGARDWIKVHSGFSGHKDASEESVEEAGERWAKSEAAGMIRPYNLYGLAKNCLSCHVVPNEELVNTGGHAPGSAFELVSWSQGEIRHNTWYNQNAENRLASPEQKRLMYVVGQAVELEVSLRALSSATVKADFAVKMAQRAFAARNRLEAIQPKIEAPEIAKIVEAAPRDLFKLGEGEAQGKAADTISTLARQIVDTYGGEAWAAIDDVVPGSDQFKGEPAAVSGAP